MFAYLLHRCAPQYNLRLRDPALSGDHTGPLKPAPAVNFAARRTKEKETRDDDETLIHAAHRRRTTLQQRGGHRTPVGVRTPALTLDRQYPLVTSKGTLEWTSWIDTQRKHHTGFSAVGEAAAAAPLYVSKFTQAAPTRRRL